MISLRLIGLLGLRKLLGNTYSITRFLFFFRMTFCDEIRNFVQDLIFFSKRSKAA